MLSYTNTIIIDCTLHAPEYRAPRCLGYEISQTPLPSSLHTLVLHSCASLALLSRYSQLLPLGRPATLDSNLVLDFTIEQIHPDHFGRAADHRARHHFICCKSAHTYHSGIRLAQLPTCRASIMGRLNSSVPFPWHQMLVLGTSRGRSSSSHY